MTKSQDRGLLTLWSRKIRERDVHCQWEGCRKYDLLHAHHFYGRRERATRYYLPNGFALCPGHHNLYTKSAEQSPAIFVEQIRKQYPKRYKDLLTRVNKVAKDLDPKAVKAYLNGEQEDYLYGLETPEKMGAGHSNKSRVSKHRPNYVRFTTAQLKRIKEDELSVI